jgi:hypothetical protein
VSSATLLGSAASDARDGLHHRAASAIAGHCWPAAGLMVFTGLGFAGLQSFWPLLLVGFVGYPQSLGRRCQRFPADRAVAARPVGRRPRPHGAVRALQPRRLAARRAGHPGGRSARSGREPGWACAARRHAGTVRALCAIGLLAAWVYRGISEPAHHERPKVQPLGPSRGIVYRMAALFSIDAFSGGCWCSPCLCCGCSRSSASR